MPDQTKKTAWDLCLYELQGLRREGSSTQESLLLVKMVAQHIEKLSEKLWDKAISSPDPGTQEDLINIGEIEDLLKDVSELADGAFLFLNDVLDGSQSKILDSLALITSLDPLKKARAACRTYRRILRYPEAEKTLSAQELFGYDQIYDEMKIYLKMLASELKVTAQYLIEGA